jgi:hypothetical protein
VCVVCVMCVSVCVSLIHTLNFIVTIIVYLI